MRPKSSLGGTALCCAVLVVLPGCDVFGPAVESFNVRSILADETDDALSLMIETPDTVEAGTAFTVRVATYNSVPEDGCAGKGPTEHSLQERLVVVEPFASVVRGGAPCTSDLKRFWHEVDVSLDLPGQTTIRVDGRIVREVERVPIAGDTSIFRTVHVR